MQENTPLTKTETRIRKLLDTDPTAAAPGIRPLLLDKRWLDARHAAIQTRKATYRERLGLPHPENYLQFKRWYDNHKRLRELEKTGPRADRAAQLADPEAWKADQKALREYHKALREYHDKLQASLEDARKNPGKVTAVHPGYTRPEKPRKSCRRAGRVQESRLAMAASRRQKDMVAERSRLDHLITYLCYKRPCTHCAKKANLRPHQYGSSENCVPGCGSTKRGHPKWTNDGILGRLMCLDTELAEQIRLGHKPVNENPEVQRTGETPEKDMLRMRIRMYSSEHRVKRLESILQEYYDGAHPGYTVGDFQHETWTKQLAHWKQRRNEDRLRVINLEDKLRTQGERP